VAESRSHTRTDARAATEVQLQDGWRVVVLNDPVNLMSYVVMVFKKVLGFAEAHVFTLQQWHLTAVLEPDEAR